MNERMRILKLLEDGKITADEAAKLLEALGEGQRRYHKVPPFRGSGLASTIARSVTSSIKESLGEVSSEIRESFKAKEKVRVSTVQGAITVRGWERDEILIHPPIGVDQIKEDGGILAIERMGNVSLKVPKTVELELTSVDGDIKISEVLGGFSAETLDGDIEADMVGGRAKIKTFNGDVDVDFDRIEEARIMTEFGDVTAIIPKKSSLKVELGAGGEIECDLPLEEMEREPGYVKGVLGKGKGLLSIMAEENGDIVVRQK